MHDYILEQISKDTLRQVKLWKFPWFWLLWCAFCDYSLVWKFHWIFCISFVLLFGLEFQFMIKPNIQSICIAIHDITPSTKRKWKNRKKYRHRYVLAEAKNWLEYKRNWGKKCRFHWIDIDFLNIETEVSSLFDEKKEISLLPFWTFDMVDLEEIHCQYFGWFEALEFDACWVSRAENGRNRTKYKEIGLKADWTCTCNV